VGRKAAGTCRLSKESYLRIKETLKDNATLNSEPLRRYLEQKKAVQPLLKKPKVTKARAQLLLNFPPLPGKPGGFHQLPDTAKAQRL
jgi:hypothetical protein